MIEMVLVRNRHTGKEKMVPPKTADDMENVLSFKKDWEVVKEKDPPPNEVIRFQEKKMKGEDPQEDLSDLSVRQLTDKVEYLTFEQLTSLKDDERVSVRKLVDKELKKREDEKDNPSKEQGD